MPLRWENQPLGNLYLTEKQGEAEFSPEDESLLVLLADQAALTIHNANLHQRAEAERQRLQSLVDTSPMAVVLIDAATQQVVIANREASRILNTPFQQGVSFREFFSKSKVLRPDGSEFVPEDRPTARALLRGERVLAEEMRIQTSDGSSILALANSTPIHGPDGAITGAITVIQDMTPLEELERMRHEFLGMVSHELRTPLTAIKGSAAMVLGSRRLLSAEELGELFVIIDEQADRLRDLVDNLLDITRIEAGTLSVTPAPTDFDAVLRDVLGTFGRTTPGYEVRVSGTAGLPKVNADARRLGQVLMNC
ncbi:MAG: PAS domain-containing protein [SAR202 cluster bacterium]|nr:PAS domain-containing protein [SAR202 cluster bacterium]